MESFCLKSARPQLELGTRPFYEIRMPEGDLWSQHFETESGYLVRYPHLADFEIASDGRSVTCLPVPGMTEESPNHIYLNQVLPLAQSVQGKLVLHASAVEIGDRAVAFAGWSGWGKSTLAADFSVNGFRFLTDDGLVLEPCAGRYRVLPSHPSIRLWKDSEEALVPAGAATALPLGEGSKVRFLAGNGIEFCDAPRELHRVYFLGDAIATGISIRRMGAAEALIACTMHSIVLNIEKKPLLASYFDEMARMADQPIFYHLDYPRRYESLASVRQAIVGHATEPDTAHELE